MAARQALCLEESPFRHFASDESGGGGSARLAALVAAAEDYAAELRQGFKQRILAQRRGGSL